MFYAYRSARLKHLAITVGAFPIGVAVIVLCAFRWHDLLVLLVFPWAIFARALSQRILCPVCKRPIGIGRSRIFCISFEWWKAIPAPQCEYSSETPELGESQPGLLRPAARTLLGVSLILVGALFMMASRGKLVSCGDLCTTASALVSRVGNGEVIATFLIAIGVLTLAWRTLWSLLNSCR